MKIILNNGTILDVILVNGGSGYFQGANRDSLEFQFAKTIPQTFEELNELFSNQANTKKLILDDDKSLYVHDNYSLKISMGLVPVVITPATSTTPEVIEERYTITMAQKNYNELQIESLRETVDALVLESLLKEV